MTIMKKLILIATGVVLFSAASFAQTDTTKSDRTQTQPQQTPTQTQPSQQMNDELKGWSTVQSADVPAGLRTTLSGDNKYKGWESGTVYRNQAGDSYAIRSSDVSNPKVYYFDKNGKVTTKPHNK
jgi:hypothetical protein